MGAHRNVASSGAGGLAGWIALFCLLAAAPDIGAADWPQFRGPKRDGTSPEKGLLNHWPKKSPNEAWRKKIGAGYSGPVVVGQRVILFHRVGNKEVVECFAVKDGEHKWKSAYATNYEDDFGKGNGPRSTPLIAGKQVVTLGAEGTLSCTHLETGKQIWARNLNDDYTVAKNFFGVGTSPILEGTRLLINIGGKGAGIVALNKDNGKEIWKVTDEGASYSSPVAATIDGVRHILFLTRTGIVSLDPDKGKVRFRQRWRSRSNASANAASPVVVKNQVFFSASYDTGAILLDVKKDRAKEIWKSDEVLSSHYETSVFHGGQLYGFDGRQELGARLRCVDWKDGTVRWTKQGFGCGSMILADGKLFILTEKGDLVLVEPTPTGYKEKSRSSLLGATRAPMALSNGRLFLRDDKSLLCLDVTKK